MLYVRADGNSEIGMGHIMRCISIAKEIVSKGQEIKFLIASDTAADVLEQAEIKYVVLGTDYRNMESEKNVLAGILHSGDKILVDSYFVTNDYFNFLREYGKVFYIDDMHAFEYEVDGIINGNIYGDVERYQAEQVLGGCKYSPIRQEYREARKYRNPEEILITTGSSDPYGITEKIVRQILKDEVLGNQKINVICGKYNESYEELKALQVKNPNVRILRNVPNMWECMQNAMVAMTAGGTTVTELGCMGVPIVCFSFVDNQEKIVKVFYERDYAYYGGSYLEEGDNLIPKLCEAVKELVKDPGLRQQYTSKLMELIDGLGCERIAEALMQAE